MSKSKEGAYKKAGVDIDKGNEFVRRIKPIVAGTSRKNVLAGIGGFSALFDVGDYNYEESVLVASTDGVGTKLAVAKLCNRHNTIGIDLVAMCVNDVIVGGVKPLFFLDYFATSKLELRQAVEVVEGVAEGCKQAGCALIGGETAEMPGLYQPGDYDLAGFVVGIGDRNKFIDGSTIQVTDKIIGIASSGLHSNGYSLVRKIFFEEHGLDVNDYISEFGCTVGEELLRPTKIYVKSVQSVLKCHEVNGIIHNTGGGFVDNIPRVLSEGCSAVIDTSSWPVLSIFHWLQQHGNIPADEMYRTFNMGIGLMVIVPSNNAEKIMQAFNNTGERAYIIGDIIEGDRQVHVI